MSKYIFVTGGVVSGLGKGIAAASLGRLLKQSGLKVAVLKLDPYMNVDPGTMSPLQHGEVFVTEDGAETDLDLGHYERFIDENLTKRSNLTAGMVYKSVLDKERAGGYYGGTVQVIPHVTEVIKDFIYESGRQSGADVMIVETGGTTGDIESQPFLEALRQIAAETPRSDYLFIHIVLVPYLDFSQEHKSKPAQHSVKRLRSSGISPDIIITRSDTPLNKSIKDKISLFCDVKPDCVIENTTLTSLYEAPVMLSDNGLDRVVCRELKLDVSAPDLTEWKNMLGRASGAEKAVNIAIVGKYVKLRDAYLSVMESVYHAGFEHNAKPEIIWIDSETLENGDVCEALKDIDAVIIPGGFGDRGIEGKISACRFAREENIPFLGICLGMQIAVIEYARNVCGLKSANSREFDENSENLVIDFMPGQENMLLTGGTMRLGAYPCAVKEGTLLNRLYGSPLVSERHRHRFEFNNEYAGILQNNGLDISGTSPDKSLVEAVEAPFLKYYIGVQFHPEFKSRPNKPHPLFSGLMRAALERRND